MQATCCDFFYFNQDLLRAALKDVLSHPEEARKLPLAISAFSDAHSLLDFSGLDSQQTHDVSCITVGKSLKCFIYSL